MSQSSYTRKYTEVERTKTDYAEVPTGIILIDWLPAC